MRSWMIAVPVAAMLATTSHAADMVRAVPFGGVAQSPAYDWTGFYVGANLGYGSAKATANFSVLGAPLLNASEDLDGFVYGAQAGYNWQIGRFVLGMEGDIQGTTQKATQTQVCPALTCNVLAITQSSDDRIPWLATLRMRGGLAWDRFFVYGTVGLAAGEFKSTQTLTTILTSVTTTVSDQRAALALGGGVEAAISRNWSAKLEYLYIDTGTFTTTYNLAGIGLITQESRMKENIVRAGLNYRF